MPGLALAGDAPWQPEPAELEKVDTLIRRYRSDVLACLESPVRAHYAHLLDDPGDEYRKMVELSTKMTLVLPRST